MKQIYNIWIALLVGLLLAAAIRYLHAQARRAEEGKQPLGNASAGEVTLLKPAVMPQTKAFEDLL